MNTKYSINENKRKLDVVPIIEYSLSHRFVLFKLTCEPMSFT